MVRNVEGKEKYMEQLKKLVVFWEYYKQGQVLTELEQESEILFNVK